MRIEESVIAEIVAKSNRLQLTALSAAEGVRLDVPQELDATRLRLKTAIDQKLQPWFVLLDESIQFLVQFERFLFEAPLSSELAGYAITVSRLKHDVISIRALLTIGQDMSARVLARTFIENMEIAMALALSADTCQAFAGTSDTNAFWNTHIGYGKVYDKVHQYMLGCAVDESRARAFVERHREAKKLFSASTHGGRDSSIFSAFAPTLSNPEEVHFLSLGALTFETARLALFVVQETHAFAGSVVKGTMHTRPLHLYGRFRATGQFLSAAASAYVLQELLLRYEEKLEDLQKSL
jgi:hypothetical protein